MLSALRHSARRALPSLPPLDRRARWCLWAILVVGAVLRLIWAVRVEPPSEFRDPAAYTLLAEHLATGHGYTYGDGPGRGITAYYPPGYPLVLGAAVWLVRLLPGEISTFAVAVGLNVVLSVATIGLVFELGRRLVGWRAGLAAAAIWALWPNLIFHSGVALTETLFLALLVAMLLVLLGNPAAVRAPGTARLVAAGLLFGSSGLVRPVSLIAAPVFVVLWWGARARVVLGRLALVGVATVAVIVPWSVRSTLAMGEPVALSLNFGDNLCIGHNPAADGGFGTLDPHCFGGEGARPEYETERQSENIDRALRYIAENPAATLALTDDRMRFTLAHDNDGLAAANDYGSRAIFSASTNDRLELAGDAFYYGVSLLALIGAVGLLRRRDPARRVWFLVAVGVVQLVSPLVTFGDPRFKMPLYPTLAVCAAAAVVTAWDRWAPERATTDAIPGGDRPGASAGPGPAPDQPASSRA